MVLELKVKNLREIFDGVDEEEEQKNISWYGDQVKDIEGKILELMKESFSRGKRIHSLELALEKVDENKKDEINRELGVEKEVSGIV